MLVLWEQVESAEDVTFNAKTSGACAADKVKFCAAVAKGGGRVMACLIENQDKPGFSPLCDSPQPTCTDAPPPTALPATRTHRLASTGLVKLSEPTHPNPCVCVGRALCCRAGAP